LGPLADNLTGRDLQGEGASVRRTVGALAFVVAVAVAAGIAAAGPAGHETGRGRHGPVGTPARPLHLTVDAPDRCDPIDPRACLLPFPNDHFTVADPSRPTGRLVHFAAASMPANAAGTHIDPTEWNRNDGFSPGSALLVHVPGIDLGRTGAAPITDIGRSLRRDAPIVIVDAATGERHPYFRSSTPPSQRTPTGSSSSGRPATSARATVTSWGSGGPATATAASSPRRRRSARCATGS
jgi:hypothetical protein